MLERKLARTAKASVPKQPKPVKASKPATPDPDLPSDEILSFVPEEGHVACDPGSSPNICYTIHVVEGEIVKSRFTKGRYYTEGGVRRLQGRTKAWMKYIKDATDVIDAAVHRTSSSDDMRNHVRTLATVYDVLWGEKLKRRWARGRLDTYIRKPKAIDRYVHEVEKQGEVMKVSYGAGRWSPSQRGRETTPVDAVSKRWKMIFRDKMTMVDEYLTSQCCMRCGCRTRPVAYQGATRCVRGLVCCDSSTCGPRRLISRDFQGAWNIMVCGTAAKRPLVLTRQSGTTKRTDKMFLKSPENTAYKESRSSVGLSQCPKVY
jgi:hypothetical protein